MIGTWLIQRNEVELCSGGGVHADEPPTLVLGEQGVGKLARHNRRWVSGSKHKHEKDSREADTVGAARRTTWSVLRKRPRREARGHAGTRDDDLAMRSFQGED
jgi:hypothetical protein